MSAANPSPGESPAASALAWRRQAAALFDLQLWCFGYDIRRPEGNLLIERGYERIAAPADRDCASCYAANLPTGERLTLRGFGLLCEDNAAPHAIFLHREDFKVSWLESGLAASPWRIDDLPADPGVPTEVSQHAARLTARAIHALADYEHAVQQSLGAQYRECALQERGKPTAIDPAQAPAEWRRIADEIAQRPELICRTPPRRKQRRRRPAKALSSR